MPSKTLKIGLVIDTNLDSSDGVQQYVKTLGAWLTNQGHEVQYLTSSANFTEWAGGRVHSLSRTLAVRFNGNRVTIPLLANKHRINQLLQNEQFDILHIQMPYSPLLAQRVIAAAGPKTAIVGTFHILPVGGLQIFASRLLRVIYGRSPKKFDYILSVSQAAAKFAKTVFRFKSEVVPNAVELKRFQGSKSKLVWPKDDGIKRIVFLGRLVERKGCGHLLKAFSNLDLTDVELLIAGDGPQRAKLEAFVAERQISNRVKFLGFINEEDKPALLGSADIACFPSVSGESFGIVLIEAMAAGSRVVLGGNNPGYASVLGERQELLFDPVDSSGLTKKLEYFLTNNLASQKAHNWQVQHVKQYDIQTVGSQVLQVYQAAVAKHRS